LVVVVVSHWPVRTGKPPVPEQVLGEETAVVCVVVDVVCTVVVVVLAVVVVVWAVVVVVWGVVVVVLAVVVAAPCRH